ncbi:sortase B cell surface sorting signal [Terribacillus halophilus]|uniref:Sortase B cell surface sorting signal n=1 Tax=Terribacillus halophilus TaxID=361279 RepID=A0A1G6LAL9_9BACI|nr:NEAT domain-containing protein [Terribacillus halophilus]SDC40183.1 sortase B cell surface sorting signal [Terribacillus halophilus]
MTKSFKVLLAAVLVAFYFVSAWQVNPVNAAAAIADGNYTIDFRVLKDGTEETSMLDTYTQHPANLTVKDGVATIDMTLLHSDWITDFKVEENGSYVSPPVVASDEANDTRTIRFTLGDLEAAQNVRVRVDIDALNYHHEYPAQIVYDISNLPQAEPESPTDTPDEGTESPDDGTETPNPDNGSETPDQGTEDPDNGSETPDQGTEDPDNAVNEDGYKDGVYSLGYKVLKDGTDEESRMSSYVVSPGKLTVADGKYQMEIGVNSSATITSFQAEQGGQYVDAQIVSEDKEADTRVVAFPIDDINAKQNIRFQVEVPAFNYKQTYTVQFQYDTEQDTETPDPGTEEPDNGETPDLGTEDPDNSSETPDQGTEDPDNGETPDPGNDNTDVNQDGYKDGIYSIDYKVLKDGTEEDSMMSNYVVSPGKLTIKDGKYQLEIGVNSSAWITSFQTEQNGEFVDAEVVSEDAAADTRVVTFPIEDINNKQNVRVQVEIPEYSYYHTYTVQFAYDTASMQLLDEDVNPGNNNHSGNNNGENPGNVTPNTPGGSGSDNTPSGNDDGKTPSGNTTNLNYDPNDDNKSGTPNVNGKDTSLNIQNNPKTFDSSHIALYAGLLLGSGLLLYRRFRRT